MTNALTTIWVVLATLVVLLVGTATAAQAVRSSNADLQWEQVSCPSSFRDDERLNFTIYLPMREDVVERTDADILHLLEQALSEDLDYVPEHAKVAALRDLFAPASNHQDALSAWLGPLVSSSACSRASAFSFRCTNIRAADILSVLLLNTNATLCYYQQLATLAFAGGSSAAPLLRLRQSELLNVLASVGMKQHVAHITGLSLHDPRMKPTRHRQRKSAGKSGTIVKKSSASQSLGGDAYENLFWPLNGEPVPLALLPVTQDPQSVLQIYFALVCGDGTYPTQLSQLCSDSLSAVSVTYQFVGQSSTIVRISSNDVYCDYAGNVLYTAQNYSNAIVCFCDVTGLSFSGSYQSVETYIQLEYASGATSSNVSMTAWFDGQTRTTSAALSDSTANYIAAIRSLYGVPDAVPMSNTMSTGIMEWTTDDPDVFNTTDVAVFMAANNLSYNPSQLNLNYYRAHPTVQGETTLDVDLVAGLVPGGSMYLWSIYSDDVSSPLDGWLQMLDAILTSPQEYPQTVWSVSWGFSDPYFDIYGSEEVHNRFRLLSIAGIHVVASSGDAGAGFGLDTYALLQFPVASPYCLAVGATAIQRQQVTSSSSELVEIVCSANDANIITSGGGYSDFFDQPSYQRSLGAFSGRGGPDVAALGANIPVFLNGDLELMFGTSASAPIVASLINLMNAYRKSIGKSALPLIHAFFYNATLSAALFRDVTQGDNCAGESQNFPWLAQYWYDQQDCYAAGVGWDAVTGLGTPNFTQWVAAALTWTPPRDAYDVVSVTKSLALSTRTPTTLEELKNLSAAAKIGIAVGVLVVVVGIALVVVLVLKSRSRRVMNDYDRSLNQQLN